MLPPRAARWSVFLDRDGVLNQKAADHDYIKTKSEFVWLPGALEALRKLSQAGVRLVIATNQQGVAKGLVRTEALDEIHAALRADVSRAGGRIDAIFVCPHAGGSCDCRKPALGLFRTAQRKLPDIVFARSIVVGDSAADVQAGRRLGARTIQVVAEGTRPVAPADAYAATLAEAVDRWILPWVTASRTEIS